MPKPILEQKAIYSDAIPQPRNPNEEDMIKYDALLQAISLGKIESLRQTLRVQEDVLKKENYSILAHFILTLDDYAKRSKEFPRYSWTYESKGLEMSAVLIKTCPALYLLKAHSIEDLKALHSKGIDLNTHIKGYNLLHQSVSGNFGTEQDIVKRVKWLIGQGIDFKSNDQAYGCGTPLHLYLANEQFELAQQFMNYLKEKLDFDARDREGKTVLIMATKVMSESTAGKLISWMSTQQIDYQDNDGRSALHYACILKLPMLITTFLAKNANLDLSDKYKKTPKDYLVKDDLLIVETLKSIEIHPGRDEKAKNNGLASLSDEKDNEVLATKEEAEKWKGIFQQYYKENPDDEDRADLNQLTVLCNEFTGKSLLNSINSRHQVALNALKTHTQKEAATNSDNTASSAGLFQTTSSSPDEADTLDFTTTLSSKQ